MSSLCSIRSLLQLMCRPPSCRVLQSVRLLLMRPILCDIFFTNICRLLSLNSFTYWAWPTICSIPFVVQVKIYIYSQSPKTKKHINCASK
ncbi:hypothetical protein HanIR_Chr08g0385341 [Helianthus annuus]|nr:hypothetical protein HanIR_Chr08g0385341 [Helianthus annuus]